MLLERRFLVVGAAIWVAATLLLRSAGERLLRPDAVAIGLLFAASFPITAWLVRTLLRRSRLGHERWPAGVVSLLVPTLMLDPFCCVFFDTVYPNIAPEMAGVFGGGRLWCCAGAVAGGVIRPAGPR